jgi:hypothetical protein
MAALDPAWGSCSMPMVLVHMSLARSAVLQWPTEETEQGEKKEAQEKAQLLPQPARVPSEGKCCSSCQQRTSCEHGCTGP